MNTRTLMLKDDVVLTGPGAPAGLVILDALWAASAVYGELMVTCGTEAHPPTDPHARFLAYDLRCNCYRGERHDGLIAFLQRKLGEQFTVLHEAAGTPNEHVHIQVRKGHTYVPQP